VLHKRWRDRQFNGVRRSHRHSVDTYGGNVPLPHLTDHPKPAKEIIVNHGAFDTRQQPYLLVLRGNREDGAFRGVDVVVSETSVRGSNGRWNSFLIRNIVFLASLADRRGKRSREDPFGSFPWVHERSVPSAGWLRALGKLLKKVNVVRDHLDHTEQVVKPHRWGWF